MAIDGAECLDEESRKKIKVGGKNLILIRVGGEPLEGFNSQEVK